MGMLHHLERMRSAGDLRKREAMRGEPTRMLPTTCIQAVGAEKPTPSEWDTGIARLRTGQQPDPAAAFHVAPVSGHPLRLDSLIP